MELELELGGMLPCFVGNIFLAENIWQIFGYPPSPFTEKNTK